MRSYCDLTFKEKAVLKFAVTFHKNCDTEPTSRLVFNGAMLEAWRWSPHRGGIGIEIGELEGLEKRGWLTLHWEPLQLQNYERYDGYAKPTNEAYLAVLRRFGTRTTVELSQDEISVLGLAYIFSDETFPFQLHYRVIGRFSFLEVEDFQRMLPHIAEKGYVEQVGTTPDWKITPEGIALAQEIDGSTNEPHVRTVIYMNNSMINSSGGTIVGSSPFSSVNSAG